MNLFMEKLEDLRKVLNAGHIEKYVWFQKRAVKEDRPVCHYAERAERAFMEGGHYTKVVKLIKEIDNDFLETE